MRQFIKIIVLSLFVSCVYTTRKETNNNLPENLKSASVVLKDSLGTVSFLVPIRFDTSFSWTNHSDCGKPCDHVQYRYQPTTLPIFKESGSYYDVPDIAIDQFTIIHSGDFPFHNGDTSINVARHEHFKSRLTSDPSNGTIVFDTIEKINDRYFSVVYLNGFNKEKQKYFAEVAALTTVKSNEIEFHYDIRMKDTIDLKTFYNNSNRYLRTIRMSNGI